MITRFHIENFKSLADFDLDLAGFTCLIGMNGAGKTTLLQAFDFTAQLMEGKVKEWLESREWDKLELLTNLGARSFIVRLAVEMNLLGKRSFWTGKYDAIDMRCIEEKVELEGETIMSLTEGRLHVLGRNGTDAQDYDEVPFEYKGSVLSTLSLKNAHPFLLQIKALIGGLHSLELLAPQLLRKRSRESHDIGSGGERLSGFLSQLTARARNDLLSRLQVFYPQVKSWRVKNKQYGWKELLVEEKAMPGREVSEAHINDGFLRVIAMLSQAYTSSRILLFDEIENGINPAIADELMKFLVSLSHLGRQVIVTTHSPVILNYLEDDVARAGVVLLFKTSDGRTQSRRYFDVPENAQKLRALGPGEVFLDTSIEDLVNRLAKEATPSKAAA